VCFSLLYLCNLALDHTILIIRGRFGCRRQRGPLQPPSRYLHGIRMSKLSNQDIEKYYFEMFRTHYPLPPGTIAYKDAPDVILDGTCKIGIEITNFFLEDGSLPESEQTQKGLREKVVSSAQQAYQAENGRNIEITFGFNKANPIRNQKTLIANIVQLAKSIQENETGRVRKEIFKAIPELNFVYLNTREYPDAKWRVVQVYNVPVMSRDRLIEIVQSKERRASQYEKCDAYWLLVVVDFMNFAQDQEIQIDGFDKIQTNVFEKVIVYKTLFGHYLEAC